MTRPLVLFVPGSLGPVMPDLVEALAALDPPIEAEVGMVAPSGALASAIETGAAADILISADTNYTEQMVSHGLAKQTHRLAGNALCLILNPETSFAIGDAYDLIQAGLRIAVFQHETDPCGQYTRRMFARIGIEGAIEAKEALGEILVAPGGSVLPDAVKSGAADAGVLYLSWAKSLGEGVDIVPLNGEQSMRSHIVFTITSLTDELGQPRHPDAIRAIEALLGTPGQRILREAGFVTVE